MAAQEQQPQRVVRVLDVLRGHIPLRRELLPAPPGLLLPDLVDEPPVRSLDQPPARVVRPPVPRPGACRRDQRLLDGVLGGGEVTRAPYQRAEDLRRQLPQ
jgi:hypothetical protein